MSGFTVDQLVEGLAIEVERVISEDMHSALVGTFRDSSPLHVDEAYARAHGFTGRVMHGAILDGLVSEFIGVHLPGPGALLQELRMRYLRPSYLGDSIAIRGTVAQVSAAVHTVRIDLVLTNTTQRYVCARAVAQVGLI